MIPQAISHYRILGKLGQGGMGEVYLAEDTRLNRNIALKFLPASVLAGDRARKRLIKEAQAAARLDHPNICAIYEVGHQDGRDFIVMQYVEGETLACRIERKPLNIKEVLEIAAQAADALAEAHSHSIIHRDIKPANIMITPRRQVKLMDFGLAMTIPQQQSLESQAQIETLLSEPGTILGTLPYMSPEQVSGEPVDERSDIFSFGAMLHEMASGHKPFAAESAAATISAILTREAAPLARYSREAPAELERIVSKALRKDREERYQAIKEMALDLKRLKEALEFESRLERSLPPDSSSAGNSVATSRRALSDAFGHTTVNAKKVKAATTVSSVKYLIRRISQHKRAAALILGMMIVSAAVWYLLSRSSSGTKEPTTLRNATFSQLTDQPGPEYFPSLSPDGKSLVYASYASGNWDIYFQRVGGKTAINLTENSHFDDTQPAFSPDGERIAFRSEREGGGIFVMGATGESVKRLTDSGFNPAWSPDGKEIAFADESVVTTPQIRFSSSNRIWAVSVHTGEKRLVVLEGTQPNWSPHGHRIALCRRLTPGGHRDIHTIPAGGGEPVEVTKDPAMDWNPVWSPDGKHLYFLSDRGGSMNLWRVPVEEQSGKVLGEPEAVTTPSPYSGHLSFSRDGKRIAYAQIIRSANLQQVGFDPRRETVTGQPVWITQGSRWANTPDLSPDGEWLAFDSQGGQQDDLFVIRRDGTSLRQLTDDIHRDRKPYWSPDGKRLVFFSNRSGKWEIWMINSDGSELQQLTDTPKEVTNAVWSPDGTRLAYRNYGSSPSIIETGKPWREQSPEVLPTISDLSDWFPWSWSPDGQKLAGFKVGLAGPEGIGVYSLESQQFEKLTDFGLRPIWLSDNRRILFQDLQARLYLLDSRTKKVREVLSGTPHDIGNGVALSRDDRLIYFSLVSTEADVWLMTLG